MSKWGEYDLAQYIQSQSGGGAGPVTPFRPESYGAIRDGSHDDTAAIIACINAAVTAAINSGIYYCEVQFSAGIYEASTPPSPGGATLGNAQIPLPVLVPETSQKVILVLRGGGRASALHWAQTQALDIGTVIRTPLTGLSIDVSYGSPSVIGSPTVQVGSNALAPWFTNLHVVVDGITVVAPQNPGIIGMDLRGCAQATVLDYAAMVEATAASLSATPPTNTLGVGLYMPQAGNNAVADIGSYSCEGWYYAIGIAEHVAAKRLLVVYCNTAMFIAVTNHTSSRHASIIDYFCAEAVSTVIDTNAANQFGIIIPVLDLEINNAGTHINDPGNWLRGRIHWNDYQGVAPRVNGAGNLRILDIAQARGAVAAPAVPATTVALINPFWRDCAVTIIGGTVTVISVDGTATGLTSGTVIVPSGKSIALTYSVAPTWHWWVM